MFDTWNPAVLNNQLNGLSKTVTGLKEEIETRVPDYSNEEANMGVKWIDGKDIYSKVISVDLPVIETSSHITVATDITYVDTLIKSDVLLYKGITKNVNRYYIVLNGSTLQILSVSSSYSEGKCNIIMYYTKPGPTP